MSEEANWAPKSCTLPTAEVPLRTQRFGRLFSESLREIRRASPTRLVVSLVPTARAEATDLAAAESDCCSFFVFTFAENDGTGLTELSIEVPAAHVEVLDGLAAQAGAALRGS